MGKEKNIKADFFWLDRFLSSCGRWFCQKQSDLMFFQQVCERTIRFCKFSEKIPADHFRYGIPNTFPPVLGFPNWGGGSIRRSRSRLTERNVLSVTGIAKGNTPTYLINVPGILSVLCEFDPGNEKLAALQHSVKNYFSEKSLSFPGPVKCRKDVLKKLEQHLHTCAKKGGVGMHIEEALEVGKVKGDVSLKRQQAKKMSNLISYPAAIFSAMKDYCVQEEIPYREYPTGKLRGCAKNWVKEFVGYDEADRMTALEFLYRICGKWLDIRSALEDAGHPQISERVSFEEYYEFRRHINDFMAGSSVRSKFGGKKKQHCSVDVKMMDINDLK